MKKKRVQKKLLLISFILLSLLILTWVIIIIYEGQVNKGASDFGLGTYGVQGGNTLDPESGVVFPNNLENESLIALWDSVFVEESENVGIWKYEDDEDYQFCMIKEVENEFYFLIGNEPDKYIWAASVGLNESNLIDVNEICDNIIGWVFSIEAISDNRELGSVAEVESVFIESFNLDFDRGWELNESDYYFYNEENTGVVVSDKDIEIFYATLEPVEASSLSPIADIEDLELYGKSEHLRILDLDYYFEDLGYFDDSIQLAISTRPTYFEIDLSETKEVKINGLDYVFELIDNSENNASFVINGQEVFLELNKSLIFEDINLTFVDINPVKVRAHVDEMVGFSYYYDSHEFGFDFTGIKGNEFDFNLTLIKGGLDSGSIEFNVKIYNCIDSDEGINYALLGIINNGSSDLIDGCLNSEKSVEYYCDGNEILSVVSDCGNDYYCDDSVGLCVEIQSTCSDSDGGREPDEYGETSNEEEDYKDECENSDSVLEYYCEGDDIESEVIECNSDEVCDDGECVEVEDEDDSDSSSSNSAGSDSNNEASFTNYVAEERNSFEENESYENLSGENEKNIEGGNTQEGSNDAKTVVGVLIIVVLIIIVGISLWIFVDSQNEKRKKVGKKKKRK